MAFWARRSPVPPLLSEQLPWLRTESADATTAAAIGAMTEGIAVTTGAELPHG